jgi:hypothetical protein
MMAPHAKQAGSSPVSKGKAEFLSLGAGEGRLGEMKPWRRKPKRVRKSQVIVPGFVSYAI